MDIKIPLLLWISVFLNSKYGHINGAYTEVNIGHTCRFDAECTAGNGGEYSKCNQVLSVCICTINHLGENKCRSDRDAYIDVCRRQTLYEEMGQCTLECSAEGTRKWQDNEDWYGEILEEFAPFIHDKKTSVCYDPRRALNTVPDGFEIKQSNIPNSGVGGFTNVYVEQGTVFGPYKGTFEPDGDSAGASGYSWTIEPRKDKSETVWNDGKDVSLSNWLRYLNTPISASMENIEAIQHEGEMYYHAFKQIQPGSELFVWYGESYRKFLGLEKFDHPRYHSADPGYVGGNCHIDDTGDPCQHDVNTVCANERCFCVHGTHFRAGKCITDETLGGVCTVSNGERCKQDANAECQGGVCVCRNNTTPVDGMCTPDEAFGGRCAARNGERCLLDNNTDCVNGICRCRYGTTGINGKCMEDEAYLGRCDGYHEEVCENDKNAQCIDNICVCVGKASAVDGKCEIDEMVEGKCESLNDTTCALDKNAECIDGLCRCKSNTSKVDGICMEDGELCGLCIEGQCYGQNVICDSDTSTCVCQSNYYLHDGKCLREKE